jgi:transcriptional regulator with XRE-family HTH domain
VRQRVEAELLEMSLGDLRRELGITQVEMANAADMAQSQISALESREDHLVSTLRRCVRALGGELEVVAVVGDKLTDTARARLVTGDPALIHLGAGALPRSAVQYTLICASINEPPTVPSMLNSCP